MTLIQQTLKKNISEGVSEKIAYFFATPLSFFPNFLHISVAYQFLVQKKKKKLYLPNYNLVSPLSL